MLSLTITQPDDWHVHLRDNAALATTVPMTAKQFARAIVMPNLKPPITTIEAAINYRQRILKFIPEQVNFDPLMTLYLTETMTPAVIEQAAANPYIYACKLYPTGATTHSDAGVKNIKNIYHLLEKMEEVDLPLLIHGEVVNPEVDIFEREHIFIDTVLSQLLKDFSQLRIVLEHITTTEAVDFVKEGPQKLAATITAHHLLINRNHLLVGGIHPHYYCLPIAKHYSHQQALLKAATSGNPKFFPGTDSAPHARSQKESACGCAGIFTAHAAIELYAEAFDKMSALDQLEKFASFHGPDFYRLPPNTKKITLHKKEREIPENYPLENDLLIPFRAGETVHWYIENNDD